MKTSYKKFVRDLLIICLGVFFVTILTTKYFFVPVKVSGNSMLPTLHNNDRGVVNRLSKNYRLGDVIVFTQDNEYLVKRIIGRPGDTVVIKFGSVIVNGMMLAEPYLRTGEITVAWNEVVTVGKNEYFVLGDNRNNSEDSRVFGNVNVTNIVGKYSRRLDF